MIPVRPVHASECPSASSARISSTASADCIFTRSANRTPMRWILHLQPLKKNSVNICTGWNGLTCWGRAADRPGCRRPCGCETTCSCLPRAAPRGDGPIPPAGGASRIRARVIQPLGRISDRAPFPLRAFARAFRSPTIEARRHQGKCSVLASPRSVATGVSLPS